MINHPSYMPHTGALAHRDEDGELVQPHPTDPRPTIKANDVWDNRQGWGFSAWLVGPFGALDAQVAWRRIERAATGTGAYAGRPEGERIGVRVRRRWDGAIFDVVL